MSATLLRAWQQRGPLAIALWPLSLLYGALLNLRRLAYRLGIYRAERLDVPVLVVGNVVVGGAGKTPTVIAVVEHLRQRGWTPGVVSRGYGRQSNEAVMLDADTPAEAAGDEPLLIARATGAPLAVARQRVAAARLLRQCHPEVDIIVSDDGMQHWSMARDVTVVVFDERACGNGWLLPAGLLREPWPARPWTDSALLALHTRSSRPATGPSIIDATPQPAAYRAERRLASIAIDHQGQARALSDFQGESLGAIAGIAQPQRFFDMLREQGVALQHTLALPDHADGASLLAALRPGVNWLCTEKDAVKLFALIGQRPDLRVWSVALQQTPEAGFFAALDQALAARQLQPRSPAAASAP